MYATITSIATNLILAQGETPRGGVDGSKVQSTPLWAEVVVPLAQGFGAFIVLVGLFKIVTKVVSGNTQGAFKIGMLTILGGAVLFNLGILFQLIGGGQSIITRVVDSITGLIGG